jgi:hypothetical protein
MTKKGLRRMGPKVCIVYGLHGADDVIRYIGQTRQHPFDRLKMHKQMARTRDKLPLHKWVNRLGDDLQMKVGEAIDDRLADFTNGEPRHSPPCRKPHQLRH